MNGAVGKLDFHVDRECGRRKVIGESVANERERVGRGEGCGMGEGERSYFSRKG